MDEEKFIIYEDANVIIINKPAGMVTTNEGRKENNSLENWLKINRPNELPRNGILHRLDKGTSGIVMTAKDEPSFEKMRQQFKLRSIEKRYYALICGDLPFEGEINVPIIRSKFAFGKFSVGVDGKKALTQFKTIKKMNINGKIFSLVDINLKTGRTHQIRVHMSYLRWPLAGDRLYGGQVIIGLDRPFLHAYQVSFDNPASGERMMVKAEMPEELVNILKTYEPAA
ncbi:MAG TPA: RluA family pseudouridine synthase [Patescibacteria group bacterium]